jgi:glycosyltransferase involved in cell wall biosynthesis
MERFAPSFRAHGGYYLFVGELTQYKRADLAIEAFRTLDRPLIIVGEGPSRVALEKRAPSNVQFLGRVSHEKLCELYAGCRALIFPGVEDFGLVPVEVMACGRPVIAFRSGGALDSVLDQETGIFFDQPTPQSLIGAIRAFEAREQQFDRRLIRRHAEKFSEERFRAGFLAIVERELSGSRFKRHPSAHFEGAPAIDTPLRVVSGAAD